MHELRAQPTWEQFEASFGEHIPATCECLVNELHGGKFKNACIKMKNTSAPWADGWRVAEFQALLLQLFEKLVEMVNLVEETGTWPVPLARAGNRPLPRTKGPHLKSQGRLVSWLPCTSCGLR